MSETDLLAVLARSGLSDAEYVRACTAVREMSARIAAADDLACAVLDGQHYQPTTVINRLTAYLSFYSPHDDAVAA